MFKKSKSSIKRIKGYIMYNTPHSSGLKNFLSIDFRIYLFTRFCRSRPVGKDTSSACRCMTHDIYIKTRTNTSKHKHTDVLLYVNDGCRLNNCYSIKCNKQQEKYCVSRAKICTSGDIELNPGPVNGYLLLQSRLAQRGLSILDGGGAGDCFFRAVSHLLYGEPSYHTYIRSVGVQHMRANPDRFIESITGDSWARYLANMSQQGTWAEALVIQAVANAFHLTINKIESNQGFSPHTAISPVAIPGHEPTVINIGHMDEIHYVSTIPYNDQCPQVIGNETVAVVNTLSKEDRRARKREWIRKKRANKEFKDKENKAKQDKRSAWIEKTKESQRQAFKKQKESNLNHVRDLNRKAFLKRKENNLEHVRELNKNAQNRKRFHSTQLHKSPRAITAS